MNIQTLSHSSMLLYRECPRKWRFRYLDKLSAPKSPALVFGSAVHNTLGAYFKARAAGAAFDLSSAWSEIWTAQISSDEVDWAGELPDLYRKDGLTLLNSRAVQAGLEGITIAQDADGALILERRIDWKVNGVDVGVIGYLDAIADDGAVIDFKTASRRWTYDQALGESQPWVYLAALAQEGVDHDPTVFRHVVLVKTKEPQFQVIETPREPDDLRFMETVVRGVWNGIKRGDYAPNPKACFAWGRRCEYFDHCRRLRD